MPQHLSATYIAQIPLGSSCHVSTRLDTFDTCIWALLRLSNSTARHDELDWLDTSVVSRRDVTSQVEFGHMCYLAPKSDCTTTNSNK